MRQTNLSLKQLREHFSGESPVWHFPSCLLVNEVGDIVLNSEEESAEAQKILASLLEKGEEKEKWIAGMYLKDAATKGIATPQTVAALNEAKSFPVGPVMIFDSDLI